MSTLINIENYEVYYLDYLEGKLNEVQIVAFLDFLEQHPELKLASEDLIRLPKIEQEKLELTLKNSLKLNLSSEIITPETVESFMIASLEKQLSKQQEETLKAFIKKNPSYQTDFEWYQKSVLPVESIIYPTKSSLKRGGGLMIPFYYKALAIAASLIFLFLFIRNYPSDLSYPNAHATKTIKKDTLLNKKMNLASTIPQKMEQNNPTRLTNQPARQQVVNTPSTPTTFKVTKLLNPKAMQTLPTTNKNSTLAKLNITLSTNYVAEIETDFTASTTYLSVEQMNTPIYLLSKEIKKRFNQEIELRSAKATRERQGGFYLKIGNIEIVRKRKPIEASLAAN